MRLNNLSPSLAEAGDLDGARRASEESVGIRCRLAQADPAGFEPNLAMSLNTLSIVLADAGDRAGARTALEEVVGIRRRLTEANPARFEPDLADALEAACQAPH